MNSIDKIVEDFETGLEVEIIGRLSYNRCPFYDIEGLKRSIQIFIDRQKQREYKEQLKSGNILKIKGITHLSNTHQPFINVNELEILQTARREFKKLPDNEALGYLITTTFNRIKRNELIISYEMINQFRDYLRSQDYLEIQTNHIQKSDVGNKSRRFKISDEYWLRNDFDIDTRIYLLSIPKIFQIGKVFRNEGLSNKNKHEFNFGHYFGTSINGDMGHEDALKILEISKLGKNIKLQNIYDAIKGKVPQTVSMEEAKHEIPQIIERLRKSNVGVELKKIKDFRNFYKREIKYANKGITILVGFDKRLVPFAKVDDAGFAYDFRILSGRSTLIHGSLEENDPEILRKNYADRDINLQDLSEGEKLYFEALEYGMQPYYGVGFSIDLLIKESLGLYNVHEIFKPLL